jgi:peptide deformylase
MPAGPTPIRRFGAACLRRPARAAEPDAPATRDAVRRLWETLATQDGVGLAAPQIGLDLRALVVDEPLRGGGRRRLAMVNPEIRETFGPPTPFREGCLSFPGLYTVVHRPQGVVVAYDDPDAPGGRRELKDDGLLARIVQHEVDHLDGVLFIDHLTPWQRALLGPRLLAIMIRGWLGR